MPSFVPLADGPLCDLGDDPQGTFAARAAASDIDRCYLVEVWAWRLGSAAPSDIGADPVASLPLCALADESQPGGDAVPLRFSDRGYASYPTDSVPNAWFGGRALAPLDVDRSLPLAPEQDSRVAAQPGNIVLANGDGFFDNLINSTAIDGRRVRVMMGARADSYDLFGPVYEGLGVSWQESADEVALQVRDASYLADVPLQSSLYAGTGGLEGTSDNAGKPRPAAFGKCRNVTPVLIDPPNLVYQFHWRAAHAVDAVYDRGAALTDAGTDHATYADLIAATVAAGTFHTCLAQGLIRINFALDPGLITCDVRGDALGGYVETAADIARRILKDHVGLSAATQYYDPSFADFATLQPAVIGWYSGGAPVTASAALNAVAGGVCAWWGPLRDGLIRIGRVEAPAAYETRHYLTPLEIISVARAAMPVTLDPPNWRRRVSWGHNWTVQGTDSLAGAVTADRRQFLAQESRIAAAADTAALANYLLPTDPAPLPTLFDDQADAEAEAQRLLDMHKDRRQMLSVRLKALGHLIDLNDGLQLTWPRFGLDYGKFFRVLGVREDCAARETIVTVWG